MDAPHQSHDQHSHHEHHEQPEETLAPDEAPTPLWLPVLGGALFLLAAIVVFAGG
ncbi:MAG TPA: hypothetical protein VJU61_05480 [Polyangiaceae bacterium]|nr:hypothetical protein [Polyangiaceae bacterium]